MRLKFNHILIILILTISVRAQVPYAFRYQASVRDDENRAINEELDFQISLFADADANEEIYSEQHIVKPDTNGLVAFSIGEGLSNYDFSEITWAEGPYYIEVTLDDEVISYSQLLSVPYAMHAQTADKLHDLQTPVFANDPTTKMYVDQNLLNTIDSLNKSLKIAIAKANSYADSLAITPKDLEISYNGDTLAIGDKKIIIAGIASGNTEKYKEQLVLGGSYNEGITKVLHTSDKGFLLLGSTLSGNGDVQGAKGDTDIWLIKLSKTLNVEWKKTLGGNAYDNGVLAIEETDGYLIGATTESNDGDISKNKGEFDILLIKVDKTGKTLWSKTYGGPGTEFLNAIIPNNDGTYYIGATTFSKSGDIKYANKESDIWIFKTDNTLDISPLNVTIGGSRFDILHSMKMTEDGKIELFGSSSSSDNGILNNKGGLDFIHLTLDTNLDILEQDCYGTKTNEQLQKISENILVGHSYSGDWNISEGNSLKNIYVCKLGNNGFEKAYGGSGNDLIKDIVTQNDTTTILSQTYSHDGDITENKGAADAWILQINKDGKTLKSKTIGGTYDETPKLIKKLPDGNWIIAGESESFDGNLKSNSGNKDIWLAKTNSNFEILWQQNYGGSYDEKIVDLHIIDANNFIIFGTTSSNDYGITGLHDKEGKSSDIWVLKTQIQ